MKKLLFAIFFFFLVIYPLTVSAIDLGTETLEKTADVAGYSPKTTTDTTFSQTIGLIIRIALSFMGTIFLGLMHSKKSANY